MSGTVGARCRPPPSEPQGQPPPTGPNDGGPETEAARSLVETAAGLGLYPLEAFQFVAEGLDYTVRSIHGAPKSEPAGPQRRASDESTVAPPEEPARAPRRAGRGKGPDPSRHISGAQLCHGLRDFALSKWGLLASTVLRRWNITCTLDFGRIVFAMVEAGHMQKTDDDNLDDFKDVFDFNAAFECDYRIEQQS